MSDTTATMHLCTAEYSVKKVVFFSNLTADMFVYINKTVVIGYHHTKVVYLTNTS